MQDYLDNKVVVEIRLLERNLYWLGLYITI